MGRDNIALRNSKEDLKKVMFSTEEFIGEISSENANLRKKLDNLKSKINHLGYDMQNFDSDFESELDSVASSVKHTNAKVNLVAEQQSGDTPANTPEKGARKHASGKRNRDETVVGASSKRQREDNRNKQAKIAKVIGKDGKLEIQSLTPKSGKDIKPTLEFDISSGTLRRKPAAPVPGTKNFSKAEAPSVKSMKSTKSNKATVANTDIGLREDRKISDYSKTEVFFYLKDQIQTCDHANRSVCQNTSCDQEFVRVKCSMWDKDRLSCAKCHEVIDKHGKESWTKCNGCNVLFPSIVTNGRTRVNCKICHKGRGRKNSVASAAPSAADSHVGKRVTRAESKRRELENTLSPIPEIDLEQENDDNTNNADKDVITNNADEEVIDEIQRDLDALDGIEATDADIAAAEQAREEILKNQSRGTSVDRENEFAGEGQQQQLHEDLFGEEPSNEPGPNEGEDPIEDSEERESDKSYKPEVHHLFYNHKDCFSILYEAGIGDLCRDYLKLEEGSDLCKIHGMDNAYRMAIMLGWPVNGTVYYGYTISSIQPVLQEAWEASQIEAEANDPIEALQKSCDRVPTHTPGRVRGVPKPTAATIAKVNLPAKKIEAPVISGGASSSTAAPQTQRQKYTFYGRLKRQPASYSGYKEFCKKHMDKGKLYYKVDPDRVERDVGPAQDRLTKSQLDAFNRLMWFTKTQVGIYSKTLYEALGLQGPVNDSSIPDEELETAYRMLERSALDVGGSYLDNIGSEVFRYMQWSSDKGLEPSQYLIPTVTHFYRYLEYRRSHGETVVDNILSYFGAARRNLGMQFPFKQEIPHVAGLLQKKDRKVNPDKISWSPQELILLEKLAFDGCRVASALLAATWGCMRLGHGQRTKIDWQATDNDLDNKTELGCRIWMCECTQTKRALGVGTKLRITLCTLSGLKWWRHLEHDLRTSTIENHDFFLARRDGMPLSENSLNRVVKACLKRAGFADERIVFLTGHSARRFVLTMSHPLKTSTIDLHHTGLWACIEDNDIPKGMPAHYSDTRLIRGDLVKFSVERLLKLWSAEHGDFKTWSPIRFIEFLTKNKIFCDKYAPSEKRFEWFLNMLED